MVFVCGVESLVDLQSGHGLGVGGREVVCQLVIRSGVVRTLGRLDRVLTVLLHLVDGRVSRVRSYVLDHERESRRFALAGGLALGEKCFVKVQVSLKFGTMRYNTLSV